MKKRLLSLLLIITMLMSFLPCLAVLGAQTQIDVAFFDAQTDEQITMLNRVKSTYAKINFVSVEEDSVIVICAAYDNKDDFLGIKSLETVSTAAEYTTPVISPDGAYTLKIFVWDSLEKMIPICTEEVLTHGITTIEFDEKYLVRAGAYSSDTKTYDNVIKDVTDDITGTQNINVRTPASGYYRRYVYVTLDLTNEKQAEQVLLNILASREGTAESNKVFVDTMESVPSAGDSCPDKTGRLAELQLVSGVNSVMQKLDITEAYNKALGTKLCLRICGWAWDDAKSYDYVKVNADSLKLDVTPYVEGKYTVTFDKGAEAIYADRDSEITLPEYSLKIPGEKFTGWSDGTNTYQAGATYNVTKTTCFTAIIVDDPDSMTNAQKLLDGKKIIFIGNSFIYYGRTVGAPNSNNYQQSKRINDKGGFYQLCKQNYIDVEVTNWTFGGHKLGDIFGNACTYSESTLCAKNHEDYLTDKYYDYVVLSPGSGERQCDAFLDDVKYISNFFKEENPDVKIIILGNAAGHGVGTTLTTIASTYKTLYSEGYPIADWGYLVKNIIDGTQTVEGATQEYNKNTFIVNADGYHPNLLTGYITTLFTYCTITGEKAEGQPYLYYQDATLAPTIDVDAFTEKYYKNGDADTTFPEILKSESDIRGIQKLVDKYIAEKAYLTEY